MKGQDCSKKVRDVRDRGVVWYEVYSEPSWSKAGPDREEHLDLLLHLLLLAGAEYQHDFRRSEEPSCCQMGLRDPPGSLSGFSSVEVSSRGTVQTAPGETSEAGTGSYCSGMIFMRNEMKHIQTAHRGTVYREELFKDGGIQVSSDTANQEPETQPS